MGTRTRTVVFTDIANFTANVNRADREALRNYVSMHERLVAPVLERHGGRVLKNLGDSFMALFPSATDAVRAGLELVETITDPTGFSIRVAAATGDVEEIEGDAFGEPVNLANRILGKAPAGQVWFSEATLLCLNQAEVAWEPVGSFKLKGIPGDARCFRAVPGTQAWLPEPVVRALRAGRLVRIERGNPVPALPPEPVLLLEGYEAGSAELDELLRRLPAVDPAALWLVTYTIPPADRVAWEGAGRGLVIALPVALERALREARSPASSPGSDTIILDTSGTAFLEIALAGLALPSVPMGEVVDGYSYDLLGDGRWVNQSDHALARVEVSPSGATLRPLAPGFVADGRQLPSDAAIPLEGDATFDTPAGPLRWRRVEGGGYLGVLVLGTSVRLGVAPGQQAEIGREPRHPGLPLPDRRGQANLRWCLGSRAARVREGGFTLDRALVGRQQCAVVVGPGGASLVGLHPKCPTYLLRGRALSRVETPVEVGGGDFIVVGTNVVAIEEPGRRP